MNKKQTILGIDPGTRTTGYGVVEFSGNQLSYITSGVLSAKGELNDRLYEMFKSLKNIAVTHQPTSVAIETSFVHKNVATAIKLGQARGMLVVAAKSAHESALVYEYTPRQIKQNLTGHGGADKSQVSHMVGLLLNIKQSIQADAADALGCALCHYNHHQLLDKIA